MCILFHQWSWKKRKRHLKSHCSRKSDQTVKSGRHIANIWIKSPFSHLKCFEPVICLLSTSFSSVIWESFLPGRHVEQKVQGGLTCTNTHTWPAGLPKQTEKLRLQQTQMQCDIILCLEPLLHYIFMWQVVVYCYVNVQNLIYLTYISTDFLELKLVKLKIQLF